MRATFSLIPLCVTVATVAMHPAGKQIITLGGDASLSFSPAVKAGGFIYVSGMLAVDEKGRLMPGDIKAQTTQVLEKIATLLKAAGSGLENAAAVYVYLKRAEDFAAMNEAYRTYWPKDPPARTTVVADLAVPESLIAIAMVAIPTGGDRQVVHPRSWVRSPSPYSYGIRSGDTLFLAGLVSRNGRDNLVVKGDMAAQTRVVLENAREILDAAGMTHGDVVSSRVYITDATQFEEMNAAYRTYFPGDPPARATVRAGLTSPEYLLEITMVAVRVNGPARKAIMPASIDSPPGRSRPHLSPAIRVGNRLYVSGMLGNTRETRGDMKRQTREALARIGGTLRAAGFTWDDVVDGVVYVTDAKRLGAMDAAYREVFSANFPARSTVQTGLIAPDGLVEIMVVAVQ